MDIQQCLSVRENVGASRQAMEPDLVGRIVQSLNLNGGDLWESFKTDDPIALLELGLMSSVMVITHPLNFILLFVLSFHVLTWSFFPVSLSVFSWFPPTLCTMAHRVK